MSLRKFYTKGTSATLSFFFSHCRPWRASGGRLRGRKQPFGVTGDPAPKRVESVLTPRSRLYCPVLSRSTCGRQLALVYELGLFEFPVLVTLRPPLPRFILHPPLTRPVSNQVVSEKHKKAVAHAASSAHSVPHSLAVKDLTVTWWTAACRRGLSSNVSRSSVPSALAIPGESRRRGASSPRRASLERRAQGPRARRCWGRRGRSTRFGLGARRGPGG